VSAGERSTVDEEPPERGRSPTDDGSRNEDSSTNEDGSGIDEGWPADCVFCAIERGERPGSVVYEDDTVFSILDTTPINPGHALVIPREHAPSLAALDEDTGAHCFRVTMRVAEAIRESEVRCAGINCLLADGEAAFQEIAHCHMHVLPRFDGDSFAIDADWSGSPSRSALDAIASDIRAVMDRPGESDP